MSEISKAKRLYPMERPKEIKDFLLKIMLLGALFISLQILVIWLIWNTVLCRLAAFPKINIWQAALIFLATDLVRKLIKTIVKKLFKPTTKKLVRDCNGKWRLEESH
jgi:uncharacterized membrane protein YqjE